MSKENNQCNNGENNVKMAKAIMKAMAIINNIKRVISEINREVNQ